MSPDVAGDDNEEARSATQPEMPTSGGESEECAEEVLVEEEILAEAPSDNLPFEESVKADEETRLEEDRWLADAGEVVNGDVSCKQLDERQIDERMRIESVAAEEIANWKAKFELMVQTFRSILRLEPGCSWADVLEKAEALANGKSGKSQNGVKDNDGDVETEDELHETVDARLLAEAEIDLELKEEQLEEQSCDIRRLTSTKSRQEELLDMSERKLEELLELKALSEQHAAELLAAEQHRFCEEAQKFRELSQLQEERLHDKEGQLATLEAALAKQELEVYRREEQLRESQLEVERQRADIEELCEAVSYRDEEMSKMKSQLEVYDAAERRRHSYRVNGSGALGNRTSRSTSTLLDDGGSEHGSSVGSARPSARGPGPRHHDAIPSTPSTDRPAHMVSSPSESGLRRGLRPPPPMATMDKDERAAFLSHFPMASRTERHLRSRIDEGRSTAYAAGEEMDPALVPFHGASPLSSARASP